MAKKKAMPEKKSWHTIKSEVHHNNTNCYAGNNIERAKRNSGTGGKPLRKVCGGLNR